MSSPTEPPKFKLFQGDGETPPCLVKIAWYIPGSFREENSKYFIDPT
jgi:hypothetical protein